MANIGTVTITVEADGSSIPGSIEKSTKGLAAIGDRMSAALSKGLSAGLENTVASAMGNVRSKIADGMGAAGSAASSALQAALRPATAQLQNFASGFNSSQAAASSLTGAMGSLGGAARSALQPAITQAQNLVAGFNDGQAAGSALTGVMGTIGGIARSGFNVAQSAAQSFGSAARKVFDALAPVAQKAWDKIKSGAQKTFTLVGEAMKSTLTSAATVAGGAVATVIGVSLTKGLSRLKTIDQATTKLSALGNSAEQVEVMMDKATTAVRGTAFGLGDAADAAAGLAAAKVPLDKVDDALGAMVSTAALANVPLGDMSGLFNKVAANGKLTGETMAQLLDRQIPVLSMIQDEYGVTAEAARKMVSDGEVDFDKFVALMGANADAAAIMGTSFSGLSSNVGAALGRIGANGLSPFFEALKPVMAALIGTSDSMGAIDRVGKMLEPTFTAIAAAVEPVATRLAEAITAFGATETAATNFLPSLAPLVPLLGLAGGSLAPLLSGLPVVGKLFAGMSGPIGLVAGGLVALLAFSPETLIKGFDGLAGALPGAIESIVGMISTMVPKMVERLATNLPIFITGIVDLITAAVPALAAAIPVIVETVAGLIPMLITTLLGAIPMLLTAALELFMALVQAIPPIIPLLLTSVIGMIPLIITALLGALPSIVSAALELFMGLVMGLVEAIPEVVNGIVDAIPVFIETLVGMIPDLIEGALELFLGIVTGLGEAIPTIITAIIGMIPVLVTNLVSQLPAIINGAIQLFLGIMTGLLQAAPQIIMALIGMIPDILAAIMGAVPVLLQAGIDLIGGLISGLWEAASGVGAALLEIAKSAIDGFLSFLGIASPSKLFAGFGGDTMDGYVKGVEKMAGNVEDALTDTIKPFAASVSVSGTPTIGAVEGNRAAPPPPAAGVDAGVVFQEGAIRVEGAGDPDRAARGVVDRIAEEVSL